MYRKGCVPASCSEKTVNFKILTVKNTRYRQIVDRRSDVQINPSACWRLARSTTVHNLWNASRAYSRQASLSLLTPRTPHSRLPVPGRRRWLADADNRQVVFSKQQISGFRYQMWFHDQRAGMAYVPRALTTSSALFRDGVCQKVVRSQLLTVNT